MQSPQRRNDTRILLAEGLQNSPREKGKSGCGAHSLWIQPNCAENYHAIMWVSLFPFLRCYSMHVWGESIWYLSSTCGQGVLVAELRWGWWTGTQEGIVCRYGEIKVWEIQWEPCSPPMTWGRKGLNSSLLSPKGNFFGLIIWEMAPDIYMGSETQGIQAMSWHRQGRFPFLKLRKRVKDGQSPVLAAGVWHYLPW